MPRLDPAWWLVLFNFLRLKSFHPPDDLPAGLSAAAAAAAKVCTCLVMGRGCSEVDALAPWCGHLVAEFKLSGSLLKR